MKNATFLKIFLLTLSLQVCNSCAVTSIQRRDVDRLLFQIQQAIQNKRINIASAKLAHVQNYLRNIPDPKFKKNKSAALLILKQKINKAASALDWSIIGANGQTRVQHVRLHQRNDLSKPVHGIFNGDAITIVNKAWNKKNKLKLKPIINGGAAIFRIPFANAGYAGGYNARGRRRRVLNRVTIITRARTNKLITAFPS